MRSIGEFFARIQNKQAQEILLRQNIQDVLKKVVGLEVPAEGISFKGGTIYFGGLSQTAKTQLFLKKNAVLAEIAASVLGRSVKDIRF